MLLSDVWFVCRIHRATLGVLKLTEVAHVTRDSDNNFKVKGLGHQAALVGCTGRRNMDIGYSPYAYRDVYRVTRRRPGFWGISYVTAARRRRQHVHFIPKQWRI